MVDHPGWYPSTLVCRPPELPTYLKSVYDLKPIVGLPSDDEVVGIHSVIHAANQVSVVPGMKNPGLLLSLTDHLFSAQMARYRSRYSLTTFPSDATYTPPSLPAHVSINLEPISGAPTDDEMMKVQEAALTYQEMRRFPSMFDARVSMELSQHLFDLQMARHMRLAGEAEPRQVPHGTINPQVTEEAPRLSGEAPGATNNAGTGANTTEGPHTQEFMEQPNRLAERFNQVLEALTRAIGQPPQSSGLPDRLVERIEQIFDRFDQIVERTSQRADQNAERSNELMERFNLSTEQSNKLAQRLNELFEQRNEHHERSNRTAEMLAKSLEKIETIFGNVNKVLVRVQHAIVRSRKDNTIDALDCLVNEKGDTPIQSEVTIHTSLVELSKRYQEYWDTGFSVLINGTTRRLSIHNDWLGELLCFYGITEELCEPEGSVALIHGLEGVARDRLGKYLSSCLG
ncbi:hypothetical protein RSOLAG22IIIB_07243 [Rhizoctonia solani]|uniref:Laminin domain protein n=1 Tax=Rhizoctonia solani TaxID=456999 RepID=A0A0K6FLM9_9AGAM|nr:hypothetical protein RSOLAG22IIIB_07243 [Rhizoctonia solani]